MSYSNGAKTATTPADARRYHTLWLISPAQTAKAAAALVGLSDKSVRALVHRYNLEGPTGLLDRRANNPGKLPLLNAAQQRALFAALQTSPVEGGGWTGQKVPAWIKQHTGTATHPQRGWEYMRRFGFTVHVPRPRHAQTASESAQTD